MPPLASDALVLRTYKTGETSQVVVLLTRERGKVRAIAKGSRGPRSRLQSALEPLSEVRVTLYGREGAELYRLGQCELVRSAFAVGERGLDTALALACVAELVDAFAPEGEADDAVYRLVAALVRAAAAGLPGEVLLRYGEAWLLKLNGLYPQLERCAGCGAALPVTESRFYHAAAHGFVCAGCGPASGPVLEAEAVAFLGGLLRLAPERVPAPAPGVAESLETFHAGLIGAHLEREVRAYRVRRDVVRGSRA